ncbi:MAG: ABC transporter substrate-binding protein [Planctomycetota bacterium]
MAIWNHACVLMLTTLLLGCHQKADVQQVEADSTWEDLELRSRGSTVRMMMWDGDPLINAYMRDYVIRRLEEEHGIRLELVGGQGREIVNRLMVDLEAGRHDGDIDLVWINGENFYQLRKLSALYGPFTDRLPNSEWIDWSNPFIAVDFQQPVEGFECPWGNVQLALIYDAERVLNPPQTLEELTRWIRENPGRFTFDHGFTGMTFLKSLLYQFAETPQSLHGAFSELTYSKASEKLWIWLRGIQPDLWRKGEVFPDGVAQLHQLISQGQVDFSMSNNDGEVDNKVAQGILPPSARAYVPAFGSIRNSHYLGIPWNSVNKTGAMVVCNLLISPEAQLEKARPSVWGDGTVLAGERLSGKWRERFQSIEGRVRIASRDELESRALMEPAPEVMIRLHEDFRRKIIERSQ